MLSVRAPKQIGLPPDCLFASFPLLLLSISVSFAGNN